MWEDIECLSDLIILAHKNWGGHLRDSERADQLLFEFCPSEHVGRLDFIKLILLRDSLSNCWLARYSDIFDNWVRISLSGRSAMCWLCWGVVQRFQASSPGQTVRTLRRIGIIFWLWPCLGSFRHRPNGDLDKSMMPSWRT
jgi:hypothetical protein